MNRRGLTLTELLIVIVIIGAMAAFAFPRIGNGIRLQSVRSARTLFITQHARARATAIQRGSRTQMVLNNGQIVIRSRNPVSGASEQVGGVEDLGVRYGVTVQPTTLTLTFDPRGIGTETSSSTITILKGTIATTIVITPVGRVQ